MNKIDIRVKRSSEHIYVLGLILFATFFCGPALSQSIKLSQHDALDALQQVAHSGRSLNYTGVFVLQKGDHFETCKIIHHGSGSQELEKIERLDGDPLEITRVNDNILVYVPSDKVVKSKLGVEERSFPSLTQNQLLTVGENYDVYVGDIDRIAGRFATHITLLPKDKLRYRHELWIDQKTGLQIKAQMYTDRNELVEQIMFTEINIGNHVTPAMTRSRYEANALGWKMDRDARKQIKTAASERLWAVNRPPSGFKQVMQLQKQTNGAESRVQLVFSDGFAAVSIFIDSRRNNGFRAGLAREGSLNVYRRVLDDQFVTVLGDVPADTVKQIGDSLVKK
ncbi:MucB/RseB C-terminal domain-containing protein [Burkholderiales bacterium]|nr:MucB/RseB C-terminal domain-containing protein [Burkholderiales bacterium]